MAFIKENQSDNWALEHIRSRKQHVKDSYARIAAIREKWINRNRYFYNRISAFLKFIIEPGSSAVIFRSELGQLFERLELRRAVGVDICDKMVSEAGKKQPGIEFICADPEDVQLKGDFDNIIFYSLGDIIDIEKAFVNTRSFSNSATRLIVINYNYLWRPLIYIAEKFGLKVPQPTQNWLNIPVLENLLQISGFEVVKKYYQVLFPFNVPLVSWLMNNVIAKLPLVKRLCFMQILVARTAPSAASKEDYRVSVIIPCKNEKGNVESAVERIPEMGKGTEIIFCDDKSTDGTADEVRRMMKKYPERDIKLVPGPGICKAKNVWSGFDAATGDILMILDADLTVIPEELPYFYNTISSGAGEFINGSRMVYPMQKEAMRTLNIIGNKFFSAAFSYLLGQNLTDTLCGTKVLFRRDWPRVKKLLGSWGITDRWGDYELIFGAAKLHLKIVEVPVHYLERTYGETKMTKRFQNGLIMLRMCMAALRKFKFV